MKDIKNARPTRGFATFQTLATAAVIGVLTMGIYLHYARESSTRPGGGGTTQSVFQESCATCHGSRGEGNQTLMAPPIANLTGWYAREQLGKFRAGLRGADPRDTHGGQMRQAVLPLSDPQIEEALSELATLPFVAPKAASQGLPAAGKEPFRDLCMECHRYNGHGELAFKSAPIAALPDWYLSAQIAKFLNGSRGYHEHDEAGHKMRQMALRPESPQQLADIIAFITSLAEEHPIVKDSRRKD